jgi:hypothetical protein
MEAVVGGRVCLSRQRWINKPRAGEWMMEKGEGRMENGQII